jgi:dihydrofolate reductase
MNLIAIVATDSKGGIAKGGNIPWLCREDLQLFKALTMDYPVIMGRKTFETLPRPLKGRENIVLSNSLTSEYVKVLSDLNVLKMDQRIGYLIGGESLYEQYTKDCVAVFHSQMYHNYNCDQFFEIPEGFAKEKSYPFKDFKFSAYLAPNVDQITLTHIEHLLNFTHHKSIVWI